MNDPTSSSQSASTTGSLLNPSNATSAAAQFLQKLTPNILLNQQSGSISPLLSSAKNAQLALNLRQKEFAKHLAYFQQVAEALGDSFDFDSKSVLVQAEVTPPLSANSNISSAFGSGQVSPTAQIITSGPSPVSPASSAGTPSIPPMFFEFDFNLENPKTFSQLLSLDSSLASSNSNNSVLLQEKLSHYIDQAEVQLVAEITRRSPHFFTALTNISSLNSHTQKCIDNLKVMRKLLNDLDKKQAIQGLSIIRAKQRLSRLNFLYSQIKVIKHYKSCQSYVQILLNQADYVGALDLINEVLQGSSELNGVKVLAHLKSQLEEMNRVIYNLSSNDLTSLCVEFCSDTSKLKRHISGSSSSPIEYALAAYDHDQGENDDFEARIKPIVNSLIRTRKLTESIQVLKEELVKVVKNEVKQFFPQQPLPDEQNSTTTSKLEAGDSLLSRRIKAQSFDAYLEMMFNVYDSMLKVLTKISITHRTVKNIINGLQKSPNVQEQESINDLLTSLFDLAHTRGAKLVTLKLEHIVAASLREFFRFYDLTKLFLNISEQIEKTGTLTLKGVLHTHSKTWFFAFHSEKVKEIFMVLEAEKWEHAGSAAEYQKIIDDVAGSGASSNSIIDTRSVSIDNDAFLLNGSRFKVITSGIILLKIIRDYLTSLKVNIIHPEIINRLIELLKTYNTKISELIVGGGAIQGAVKNITAKHLALSSQTLLFITETIPSLKNKISKVVEEQVLKVYMSEFELVVADFATNRERIHSRILNIMEERIKFHIENLDSVDWDKPVSDEEKKRSSEYMVNLVSETGKLFRILKRSVFPDTIKKVFVEIFKMYNTDLARKFEGLAFFTSAGKQRVISDVQYYLLEMSKFEGVDPPSKDIELTVNKMKINELPKTPSTSSSANSIQNMQSQPDMPAVMQKPATIVLPVDPPLILVKQATSPVTNVGAVPVGKVQNLEPQSPPKQSSSPNNNTQSTASAFASKTFANFSTNINMTNISSNIGNIGNLFARQSSSAQAPSNTAQQPGAKAPNGPNLTKDSNLFKSPAKDKPTPPVPPQSPPANQ